MLESATAFGPATVANVACGFDVLGFPIHGIGDTVRAVRVEEPGVRIRSIEGDGGLLPREAEKNTAGVSVLKLLEHLGTTAGIELELTKGMPIGSGLGSSSASTVASVVAVNHLLGSPLGREELLPFVLEGERIACGAAHADNVAPSLLGGFILVRCYEPLDVVRLESPPELRAVVVHPHVEVRTEDARKILRKQIALCDAITQWGNIGGLVAGLLKNDYSLIGRSLTDVIIEPERAVLIPGFREVQTAARSTGALGCSISGSGPSIFALCRGDTAAVDVSTAMVRAFLQIGIESTPHISKINLKGARILRP